MNWIAKIFLSNTQTVNIGFKTKKINTDLFQDFFVQFFIFSFSSFGQLIQGPSSNVHEGKTFSSLHYTESKKNFFTPPI